MVIQKICNHFEKLLSFFMLIILCSCSAQSAASSTALLAGLIGGGAGVAGGAIIGQNDRSIGAKRGAVALGTVGALLGATAGSVARQNEIDAQRETYFKREPYETDQRQLEIDKFREQVYESSSWGRNEVRPYEERYVILDENPPYQGPK